MLRLPCPTLPCPASNSTAAMYSGAPLTRLQDGQHPPMALAVHTWAVETASTPLISALLKADSPKADAPKVALPKAALPKAPCAQFRTEEYLSVFVGLLWFSAVALLTLWNPPPPGKIARWAVLFSNGSSSSSSSTGSPATTTPGTINSTTPHPSFLPALADSFTHVNTLSLLLCVACTTVTAAIVQHVLHKPFHVLVTAGVCAVAFAGQVVGAYEMFAANGISSALWCILFGTLLRVAFNRELQGMPTMSFAIMVSIVLLAINLKSVGLIGAKALVVAWAETATVLVTVFYFGKHVLRMPEDEALLTAAGLSICGSSAVVSVSEVVQASDTLKVAVIGIMAVLTVPCMLGVPRLGLVMGLNNDTIGAWVGGSIDSTGAVVASASLANTQVVHTAVIVKMLQNVMIGPVVVGVTLARTKACRCRVLWDKFPKFVLGFLVVAVITTVIPDPLDDEIAANSFVLSEWFASVSFVLLGYDMDLRGLRRQFGAYGKVLALYVLGQFAVDTFTTLAVAYAMFGV